ncbi:MAG: hypothetical protein ACLFQZ_09285 [Spirochaetaceae bacterium]
MKARRIVVTLCALYEALRLAALYLIVYVTFPGEFGIGFGPLLLAAAMPAFALIALLAAGGIADPLWRPLFLSYRIYKALSIPVWGYLLIVLLSGPLMNPQLLIAVTALGVVDLSLFLLSFLAPGENGEEAEPEKDHHPKHEETEVE